MSASFSPLLFAQVPLVGILRGFSIDKLAPIIETVKAGGLTNLEITMNTPGAIDQIRAAVQIADSALNIGAGTVTNLPQLDAALAAGATFIVTPILALPVIERCVKLGVPVFPGAFTPTEIVQAWELGATMVKVFPAESLGPSFIKNLKGPCPYLRLMPTGGVDLNTLAAYAQAGADAFGVGSPLFQPDKLAANDWPWLRQQCRAFVQAAQTARP
jgi:2-dehydro-3-deoxyphosphogluconate aldolase/(4S)-4-hydroxy-2-oxoglutarate aldolase